MKAILTIWLFLMVSALLLFCGFFGCDDDEDDSNDNTDDDDDNNDDNADDDETMNDDDEQNDDDDNDDNNDDDNNDNDECSSPGGGPEVPLQAGVAVGDFYAPVGISMGGFGSRSGKHHPLAITIGGSEGYIDRMNVKAVTLDNGADRLVIARVPISLISAVLYTKVIDSVCDKTGLDLTEKLWLSSTHSHSGPDHHYPLPVPFGLVGTDTYDETITNRMAESIAQVIAEAMNALEPAALASTIVTPFDPDDHWSKDRRCHNNPPEYKEDRLFLTRIDRADGTPLAGLISYGVHGTLMRDTLMTSDAPGAAEYGLEKTFDTPVPILFMQGAGGDVRPVESPYGHGGQQGMEWIAHSIGPVLKDVWDSLSPKRNITFEMVSKRIPISRDLIGYEPGEFGRFDLQGNFHEYADGAFFCGDSGVIEFLRIPDSVVDCDNPATSLVDGHLACLWNNSWIPLWAWFVNDTTLANIRLDDTVLSIMPGELTGFLAQYLRESLENQMGWNPDKIAAFGYSLAHQQYLLREWDWYQGGYATGMNYWGPKFGDWLADRNAELALQLLTPEDEDNITGSPQPQRHPYPYSLCPAKFEQGQEVGTVQEQVAPSYERFDNVRFSWAGGYTGIGTPRVIFEVDGVNGFEAVVMPDGRTLTDAGIETVVRYQPEPPYWIKSFPTERLHKWSIDWELTADVPEGLYRIRVEGETWNGSNVVPFTVTSTAFNIVPSDDLIGQDLNITDMGKGSYRIECDGYWPPNPTGYRVRHFSTHPDNPAPLPEGSVIAKVTLQGGGTEDVELALSYEGHFEAVFTPSGIPESVTIETGGLTDAFQNFNGSALEWVMSL